MEDGLRALFQQKQALKTPKPFKLVVFKGGGPSPGVDLSDNSALADLMDSGAGCPFSTLMSSLVPIALAAIGTRICALHRVPGDLGRELLHPDNRSQRFSSAS